uniref:F-acid glycoprotein n=1 Tax=Neoditrema ransonnetii TaxID=100198 RepID=B9WZB4_9TELE|nr:F-acid glycoprotein [Neoditrema ransonnetii]
MNLQLKSHFLLAALFVSSSALMAEECENLITPTSPIDPSTISGRFNVLMAYTNVSIFKAILEITNSSWMNISASPLDPNDAVMYEMNKINGTCIASTVNMTIRGNTADASFANVTSVFQVLLSCDNCLLITANSTVNNGKKFLEALNLSTDDVDDTQSVSGPSLYLMARESTDVDVEHFKRQASCLGFTGEPDFIHQPEQSFCQKDEGIIMPNL